MFHCNYLPAVVEVPVGVDLQLLHLLHLVQHLMHIELGQEEFQTAVSVSLTAREMCQHNLGVHSHTSVR